MLLETCIKDFFSISGDIYACEDYVSRTIKHGDDTLEFIMPDLNRTNTIKTAEYTLATEVYYSIVMALLFDLEDIEIHPTMYLGDTVVNRSSIWKLYETFEVKLANSKNFAASEATASKMNFDLYITQRLEESSLKDYGMFEVIAAYIEENDNVDEADIAELISPTMYQKLQAELRGRFMLKDSKTLGRLF